MPHMASLGWVKQLISLIFVVWVTDNVSLAIPLFSVSVLGPVAFSSRVSGRLVRLSGSGSRT